MTNSGDFELLYQREHFAQIDENRGMEKKRNKSCLAGFKTVEEGTANMMLNI